MPSDISNCVAIGVGRPLEAATYYERVLGYRLVGQHDDWVEMDTGLVRLFLTHQEVECPIFKMELPDEGLGIAYLCQQGFTRTCSTPPTRPCS